MAFRFKSRVPDHVDVQEFISAGSVGLMEALARYDFKLGVSFQAYADNRIRGAMLDEMRRMDWFSKRLRRRLKAIDACVRDLERDLERTPSAAEIAGRLGLSEQEVEQGLEALESQHFLSLDLIEEYISLSSTAMAGTEPFQEAVFGELVDKLVQYIDELTDRERMVMSLYYTEDLTMREVAEVLSITEGRVSQLHSQAIKKLRQRLKDMG